MPFLAALRRAKIKIRKTKNRSHQSGLKTAGRVGQCRGVVIYTADTSARQGGNGSIKLDMLGLALNAGSSNSRAPFLRGEIDSKNINSEETAMAGKSDFSPGGERVNPAGQSALD